jgi:recombination protein RecR
VLHGALSPLDGIGPEDLKIASLIKRLEQSAIQEIIIATNFTVEGDATALYLAKLIQPFGIRLTRLAYGIPMGSELEYVDEATVNRAVEGRRDI